MEKGRSPRRIVRRTDSLRNAYTRQGRDGSNERSSSGYPHGNESGEDPRASSAESRTCASCPERMRSALHEAFRESTRPSRSRKPRARHSFHRAARRRTDRMPERRCVSRLNDPPAEFEACGTMLRTRVAFRSWMETRFAMLLLYGCVAPKSANNVSYPKNGTLSTILAKTPFLSYDLPHR